MPQNTLLKQRLFTTMKCRRFPRQGPYFPYSISSFSTSSAGNLSWSFSPCQTSSAGGGTGFAGIVCSGGQMSGEWLRMKWFFLSFLWERRFFGFFLAFCGGGGLNGARFLCGGWWRRGLEWIGSISLFCSITIPSLPSSTSKTYTP